MQYFYRNPRTGYSTKEKQEFSFFFVDSILNNWCNLHFSKQNRGLLLFKEKTVIFPLKIKVNFEEAFAHLKIIFFVLKIEDSVVLFNSYTGCQCCKVCSATSFVILQPPSVQFSQLRDPSLSTIHLKIRNNLIISLVCDPSRVIANNYFRKSANLRNSAISLEIPQSLS